MKAQVLSVDQLQHCPSLLPHFLPGGENTEFRLNVSLGKHRHQLERTGYVLLAGKDDATTEWA